MENIYSQVIIIIIFDYLAIQFEFSKQWNDIRMWIICNILQDQGENLEDGEGKAPACFPDTKETSSDRNKLWVFLIFFFLKVDEKDQEKLCLIRSE